MAFFLISLFPRGASSAAICQPQTDLSGWPYNISEASWYSCASSAGATNDMGNTPLPCSGDPTSVFIQVRPGYAECLVAQANQCKIPMHDFVSLDYDFAVDGCNGIWAAPLWMTPDTWQWGAGSGEIDSLEMCPRSAIYMNFAGGGHQVKTPFSIDGSNGHVTIRKDGAGIVTISSCSETELTTQGQCPPPVYSDCNSCLASSNTYACWCNENTNPPNIYGSGGCQNGGDCMWTIVSDIWNGVSGDEGYTGCMTNVGGVVPPGQPNLNSNCATAVTNVTILGNGTGGALTWPSGTPSYCSVFTPKGSSKSTS